MSFHIIVFDVSGKVMSQNLGCFLPETKQEKKALGHRPFDPKGK